MTALKTIQSWSREELESAFSQRESQLQQLTKDYKNLVETYRYDTEQLKQALASSTAAGHAAFEAERKRAESAIDKARRVVGDGPRTLEAKWLDPKCWDGCQSLVFKAQVELLQAELAAFHAAMQRERKPDWEKWHMDLADRMDFLVWKTAPVTTEHDGKQLEAAARELRSMATVFTHKCNFVPTDLEIKALKEQNQSMREALLTARHAMLWYEWHNSSDHDCMEYKAQLVVEQALATTPTPDHSKRGAK